jgi:hypothetical protein
MKKITLKIKPLSKAIKTHSFSNKFRQGVDCDCLFDVDGFLVIACKWHSKASETTDSIKKENYNE